MAPSALQSRARLERGGGVEARQAELVRPAAGAADEHAAEPPLAGALVDRDAHGTRGVGAPGEVGRRQLGAASARRPAEAAGRDAGCSR